MLDAAGLTDPSEVIVLRHTVRPKDLTSLRDMSEQGFLAYTRVQKVAVNNFPKKPPALWLVFVAEGERGTRSRFYTAYENRGEVPAERTDSFRSYDLHLSPVLESLRNRLVIEWGAGSIRWSRLGAAAAPLPVVEIADPTAVPFPGYGAVLLPFDELQKVVADRRYFPWQAALREVQGIYAISDARTGKLYVGKADGKVPEIPAPGAFTASFGLCRFGPGYHTSRMEHGDGRRTRLMVTVGDSSDTSLFIYQGGQGPDPQLRPGS